MSRIVRIRGDRPLFPANACVHCLRPATQEVEILKVKGYTVRAVNVPFCDDCVALRRHKSARQITFERIATVNSILLALAVGVRVCVSACEELSRVVSAGRAPAIGTLVSMPAHGDRVWVWGLLLGALSALIVFGVMYLIVPPWSRRFRSPATQAALRAVTIVEYDWETTTLEFADGEYADRFALVNQQEG